MINKKCWKNNRKSPSLSLFKPFVCITAKSV